MEVKLNPNERIDDLQYKGFRIIQNSRFFCFGMDAVLLANFVDAKKGQRVIDLGTGTGIIPILISAKTEANYIIGIDIQAQLVEMAQRSIILNDIQSRVEIIRANIKDIVALYGKQKFDIVVTNPPYMTGTAGIKNECETKAISRHEIACTLEDVISSASQLLVNKGSLIMVHRPNRMVDVIYLMRKHHVEPKLIRFVQANEIKEPKLMLIKGIKGGRPHLEVSKPLYIYDKTGNYSKEIIDIYGKEDRVEWIYQERYT